MTEKPENPQAFPATTHGAEGFEVNCPQYGMTLRDYFAAAALQGLLASNSYLSEKNVALCAYEYANAMLTARQS